MNPQTQLELNSSATSTVVLNGAVTGGHRNVTGFASLINLKDECTVTRGRRIQISQLGQLGGQTVTSKVSTEEEIGPVMKKRWSFHSSNQINDILKEDTVMKPISPQKRRKSSGSSLHRTVSDPYAFVSEITAGHKKQDHSKTSGGGGKEQAQSSTTRGVLNVRQPQAHHRHHHGRRSKLVTLREAEGAGSSSRSSRQRFMDEYLLSLDDYSCGYQSYRSRKSKQSREPPAPDLLSALPDEVLLRIFKHLPKTSLANLAQTSQRFLGLIEDETLWKRLCVQGKILNPEHLMVIMSRKPVYLRMARATIPDPITIPSDLTSLISASQLTHLDLSGATIDPSTLALILKLSPKLVKLSLEHLIIKNEVLDSMMSFVATIEVLNLTMCYDLDDQKLIKFIANCVKLRELNLGCIKVDWGIEDLTAVLNALPGTITQLNISGFRNLLDNDHVKIVCNRCPKLIELDISDSQEVKGDSIDYIVKLTKLQHLGLSRCYGIDPPYYTHLASLKSLKYIDLFSLFKENSIRQLSTNLPGIEINKFPFSAIARPTVGNKRSSIWLQRVRD